MCKLHVIIIFLLLFSPILAVRNYDGRYQIIKCADATMGEIPLPKKNYVISLRRSSVDDDQKYQLGIEIGNDMGAPVEITATNPDSSEDNISVGLLISTYMMPLPDVYKVEVAVGDIIENATTISLANNILTIKGENGIVQGRATRKVWETLMNFFS